MLPNEPVALFRAPCDTFQYNLRLKWPTKTMKRRSDRGASHADCKETYDRILRNAEKQGHLLQVSCSSRRGQLFQAANVFSSRERTIRGIKTGFENINFACLQVHWISYNSQSFWNRASVVKVSGAQSHLLGHACNSTIVWFLFPVAGNMMHLLSLLFLTNFQSDMYEEILKSHLGSLNSGYVPVNNLVILHWAR